jgi:hypothetical protein
MVRCSRKREKQAEKQVSSVFPGFMSQGCLVEFCTIVLPQGHEAVHVGNEALVMMAFEQDRRLSSVRACPCDSDSHRECSEVHSNYRRAPSQKCPPLAYFSRKQSPDRNRYSCANAASLSGGIRETIRGHQTGRSFSFPRNCLAFYPVEISLVWQSTAAPS